MPSSPATAIGASLTSSTPTEWSVNHKAVARLMRQNGLQVRPLRKFVRTTDSAHDGPIFPNRAAGFRPTDTNQLWVGDITYISIAVGLRLPGGDSGRLRWRRRWRLWLRLGKGGVAAESAG